MRGCDLGALTRKVRMALGQQLQGPEATAPATIPRRPSASRKPAGFWIRPRRRMLAASSAIPCGSASGRGSLRSTRTKPLDAPTNTETDCANMVNVWGALAWAKPSRSFDMCSVRAMRPTPPQTGPGRRTISATRMRCAASVSGVRRERRRSAGPSRPSMRLCAYLTLPRRRIGMAWCARTSHERRNSWQSDGNRHIVGINTRSFQLRTNRTFLPRAASDRVGALRETRIDIGAKAPVGEPKSIFAVFGSI